MLLTIEDIWSLKDDNTDFTIKGVFTWGKSHRDDFVISYRVYMMTVSLPTMLTLKLNQNRKYGVYRRRQ